MFIRVCAVLVGAFPGSFYNSIIKLYNNFFKPSTGAIEGQYFKRSGTLIKMSEQLLIDCNKDLIYGNFGS